jgi:hypothetical protein
VVCKIVAAIVALLLTLTTVFAFLRVWSLFVLAGRLVVVPPAYEPYLALLTFIVSLMAWFKVVRKMCPCTSKGCGCGAGCSCGGKCDCAKGGTCPGCGHSPCTCQK